MSWSCHFCRFLSAVLIVYARVAGKVPASKSNESAAKALRNINVGKPSGALFFTLYHATHKSMIKVEVCPKRVCKIRRNVSCPDRKTKHLNGPETKCHEAINVM